MNYASFSEYSDTADTADSGQWTQCEGAGNSASALNLHASVETCKTLNLLRTDVVLPRYFKNV